jgi:hypothetical protein
MNRPKQNDTSLAFVDVITNGLGGMLMLFFVVVLIQRQLEWADNADTSDRTISRDSEPFVLIVRSKDGSTPFRADSVQSVWRFEGTPPDMISDRRGVQWDWGADYAVFISNRPLGLNSRASVRTNNPKSVLNVALYPSGAQVRTYEVESAPGTWTEVWPALDSR